jgi:hypothetical protein
MQIGQYKNKTLEDAKWYLECIFGIKLHEIDKYPEIKRLIKENADYGYVLDCLLMDEINKAFSK